MKNIKQGNNMADWMLVVAFIGLIVLESFVEHPVTHINMATDFLADFL